MVLINSERKFKLIESFIKGKYDILNKKEKITI